ncbi:hypothetical protein OKW76_06930 [Sphingomonas sp. S1-29]|uniref:hypothetical protein n=1 Tax=Sphingomonas sp. S1-29 TaxID=2991074 RepID=UPI00223F3988|nr:hypothetical protein [Sphingomonas sp. S1-29]UZK71025.1 hypothetical protein OKW76_06930 [Sphingomonas sp. S1-29]
MTPQRFTRFAAIDWSGARGHRHRGIAVGLCEAGSAAPVLVRPPGGIWSRAGVLDWLRDQAASDTLIGFDFSFAPPWIERGAYLPGLPAPDSARAFWRWIDAACDDADLGAASFLERHRGSHFYLGAADGPKAGFLHFRRCEARYNANGGGKPSTVYDAIGAAQVAKASFAGMRLLHHLGEQLPVWPFDPAPRTGGCVVEIYTTIAARAAGLRKGLSKLRDRDALDAALAAFGSHPHDPATFTQERASPIAIYDDHATDALLTAAWLRANAHRTELWSPAPLTRHIAQTEGWTFGVT